MRPGEDSDYSGAWIGEGKRNSLQPGDIVFVLRASATAMRVRTVGCDCGHVLYERDLT